MMEVTPESWAALVEQLARMEASLGEVRAAVIEKPPTKEWYTPEEVGKLLGKATHTVREYCRHGRVHSKKRGTGRGLTLEWVVSAAEVERIRNEGLLPLAKNVPDRL